MLTKVCVLVDGPVEVEACQLHVYRNRGGPARRRWTILERTRAWRRGVLVVDQGREGSRMRMLWSADFSMIKEGPNTINIGS